MFAVIQLLEFLPRGILWGLVISEWVDGER